MKFEVVIKSKISDMKMLLFGPPVQIMKKNMIKLRDYSCPIAQLHFKVFVTSKTYTGVSKGLWIGILMSHYL